MRLHTAAAPHGYTTSSATDTPNAPHCPYTLGLLWTNSYALMCPCSTLIWVQTFKLTAAVCSAGNTLALWQATYDGP